MDQFLSCDWGTSSFRLRLIETATLKILSEIKTNQGIANTFSLWQQSGNQLPDQRLMFYLNLVRSQIQEIEKKHAISLHKVPVFFSGMASSSIGMMSLPYGPIPFHTDGSDIKSAFFESQQGFDHPVLLISGICSDDDVMRGEETQLIGVINDLEEKSGEKVFIFPGTHSKHIWVKDQQVTGFKTYMTGEYFNLLATKSILSTSLEIRTDFDHNENLDSFKQGVYEAARSNILNLSFKVRTNDLFGKMSHRENFNYLSGIMIGTELKELLQKNSAEIYLCCGSDLKTRYKAAMTALGIEGVQDFSGQLVDEAVIRGQFQIYQQLQKR